MGKDWATSHRWLLLFVHIRARVRVLVVHSPGSRMVAAGPILAPQHLHTYTSSSGRRPYRLPGLDWHDGWPDAPTDDPRRSWGIVGRLPTCVFRAASDGWGRAADARQLERSGSSQKFAAVFLFGCFSVARDTQHAQQTRTRKTDSTLAKLRNPRADQTDAT